MIKVKESMEFKNLFLKIISVFLSVSLYAREMPVEVKDLEFGYHTAFWSDFNADGNEDLFFLSGYESVFSTFIYLHTSSDSKLNKIYHNKDSYSMVMDIDHDDHPEFIKSSGSARCRGDFFLPEIPDDFLSKASKEYHKIVGKYGEANFTYNMPKQYPLLNLEAFNKIIIYRIEGTALKDVTREFPVHIKWRINFLKNALKYNEGPCTIHINGVIKYLQNVTSVRKN
ncbi:MAG: hypothetical protein GY820_45460 [Gammaproteobacteria bacterium]|nr:hypothetical protein [Gammaproteobacteria bacterium]